MGTPSEKIWPGYNLLHGSKATWADQPGTGLRSRTGTHLSELGLTLLSAMLTYDPTRRITASAALTHQYFKVIFIKNLNERLFFIQFTRIYLFIFIGTTISNRSSHVPHVAGKV